MKAGSDNISALPRPSDSEWEAREDGVSHAPPLSDAGGTTSPRMIPPIDYTSLLVAFENQNQNLREWQEKVEHMLKAQAWRMEERTDQLLSQFLRPHAQPVEAQKSVDQQAAVDAQIRAALDELSTPRFDSDHGNASNNAHGTSQNIGRKDSAEQSAKKKNEPSVTTETLHQHQPPASDDGDEDDQDSTSPVNNNSLDAYDEGHKSWIANNYAEKEAGCASNKFKQQFKEVRASMLFANNGDMIAPEGEAQEQGGDWKAKLERLVYSTHFDFLVALVIGLNTISIGAQTDWKAQHLGEPEPEWWKITEWLFCAVFLTELIMRVVVEGITFITGPNQKWNCFDTVVVGFSVIELLVPMAQSGAFRVLRLARVFRMIRVMRFLHELRKMISGIISTLGALFWAMVLLVMVMYIFSIIMTENVMDIRSSDDYDTSLDYHYGSLSMTLYSSFKAISGGTDWGDLSDPLCKESWIFGIVFIAYVAFAVFCVLNIVTAVFVDHANSICQDEDLKNHKKLLAELRKLFMFADVDGDGQLALHEFQKVIHEDQVQTYLRKLDLDVDSIGAKNLFELLDLDKKGEIDVETFIKGVIRVKGKAKSFDVYKIYEEISVLQDKIDDQLGKKVEHMLSWMERCQKHVMGLDQSIKTGESTNFSKERKRWKKAVTKLTAIKTMALPSQPATSTPSPKPSPTRTEPLTKKKSRENYSSNHSSTSNLSNEGLEHNVSLRSAFAPAPPPQVGVTKPSPPRGLPPVVMDNALNVPNESLSNSQRSNGAIGYNLSWDHPLTMIDEEEV